MNLQVKITKAICSLFNTGIIDKLERTHKKEYDTKLGWSTKQQRTMAATHYTEQQHWFIGPDGGNILSPKIVYIFLFIILNTCFGAHNTC